MVLSLSGELVLRAFLESEFKESCGRFSPDGRFFAYVSNEMGRNEVYMTTFPEAGPRSLVSTEGGWDPKWRPDRKELYFVSSGGMLNSKTPRPRLSMPGGYSRSSHTASVTTGHVVIRGGAISRS